MTLISPLETRFSVYRSSGCGASPPSAKESCCAGPPSIVPPMEGVPKCAERDVDLVLPLHTIWDASPEFSAV